MNIPGFPHPESLLLPGRKRHTAGVASGPGLTSSTGIKRFKGAAFAT